MKKMKILIYAVVLTVLPVFQGFAGGQIKVVDGDSLFIGNREIRLSGIDAPEYHQLCFDQDGVKYECGKEARRALVRLVGPDLKCQTLVRDKYKRDVAVCKSNGVDLNRKMVETGWAVAYKRYTDEYDAAEKGAKRKRLGIWQGKFMKPELYRILRKKAQQEH